MKLVELEVKKLRGIVDLQLVPNAGNLVLLGPNGSGKSAVVDALDFLLTGNISHLRGPGTGGLTLEKHGRHIDHPVADTEVRAVFQVPGLEQPVELRRRLEAPETLVCDAAVLQAVAPILDLAARGQHLLTRRQLLAFIVSEPASRGAALEALLSLDQMRQVRTSLVQVANELGRQRRALGAARDTALAALARTLGTSYAGKTALTTEVNRLREILGGTRLDEATSASVKAGVAAPILAERGALDVAMIRKDAQVLLESMSDRARTAVASLNTDLHAVLNTFRTNPGLLRALHRTQLIDLGVTLLDETGLCPLCDTQWKAADLRGYLEGKRATAMTAGTNHERLTEIASEFTSRIDHVQVSLQPLLGVAASMSVLKEKETLQRWETDLSELRAALQTPLEAYSEARFSKQAVETLMAPEHVSDVVANVVNAAAAKSPEPTVQQRAWDQLTRLEENLRSGEDLGNRLRAATTGERQANLVLAHFEAARDAVLESLYDAVNGRFTELYRTLHNPDESSFESVLEPEGAGMKLEVEFHGRGKHPPRALHSEGHQDSMGLCLFLALAEHLALDHIGFLILDDVLMSVDADHRHRVAELLGTRMRDRQLIITTHDRSWAHQLRWAGVVSKKALIEFRSWSLQGGPSVFLGLDVWERIHDDLLAGDAAAAAARLRRWAEEFFAKLCDAFEGTPVYHLHGRYELGEYQPAAVASFRKVLAAAKRAATSWNRKEDVNALVDLGDRFSDALRVTKAEEWVVNATVHYNTWANMTAADLKPVVDAFKTLSETCTCATCGSLLRLAQDAKTSLVLTCACGGVAFGLTEKAAN